MQFSAGQIAEFLHGEVDGNAQVLVFPAASTALYSTIVVSIGNGCPLAKPVICETEGLPQLSVATGVPHEAVAEQVGRSDAL